MFTPNGSVSFVTLRPRIRSRVTGPACLQLDEGDLRSPAFALAAAASRSPRSAQGAPRRVWSSSTRVTQPGNSRRNRGTNNTGYKEEPGWTFVGGGNRCQPGLTV